MRRLWAPPPRVSVGSRADVPCRRVEPVRPSATPRALRNTHWHAVPAFHDHYEVCFAFRRISRAHVRTCATRDEGSHHGRFLLRSAPARRPGDLPGLRHRRHPGRGDPRRTHRCGRPRRSSRRRPTEVVDVSGKLVLPGMIDTHAPCLPVRHRPLRPAAGHGRRALRCHHCDRPGRPILHDAAGLPPASSRRRPRPEIYAFLSAYLVGGLEGHFYPNLYSPDGVDIEATVKSAVENRDLVRGIKGHAEIGGFARWGIKVMEMAAAISRRAELPLYVHFGQLWGLPEIRRQRRGRRHHHGAGDPAPAPRRCARAPVHPASGRLHQRGRRGPSDHPCGDGCGAPKVDVGHGSHFSYRVARASLPAGVIPYTLGADMHGYNTEVPKPAGTPDEHHDDENHPFLGQARFSLTPGDEFDDGARHLPSRMWCRWSPRIRPRCSGLSDRIGALTPGFSADVSVLHDHRGKFLLRDNEDTQSHRRSACCSRPSACAGASASRPTRRSCRRRSRRERRVRSSVRASAPACRARRTTA